MPLVEVKVNHQVSASIRLDETTVEIVDQYAAMLQAPADDVVNATLAQTLTKCKDFQAFLKTPQAEGVRPSLRIRKVPADTTKRPQQKRQPAATITPTAVASAAGSKA